MIYPEFKNYLENNASGFEVYLEKAMDLQISRNKNRSEKKGKKWNQVRMERAAYEMWEQVANMAYQQIKDGRKELKAGMKTWEQFIEEVEFIETFNNGIDEMEFE